MSWSVREVGFDKSRIARRGNTFMIGNGMMGVRGTLEEYAKGELAAITLAGLFDKVGDNWREPVNAPNVLSTRLYYKGRLLSVLETEPLKHLQELDIRYAIHRRVSVFRTEDGNEVTVSSERFASLAQPSLIAMKYAVSCREPAEVVIETGIDGDVWDINGPHLESIRTYEADSLLFLEALTHEQGIPVAAVAGLEGFGGQTDGTGPELGVYRALRLACVGEAVYTVVKFAAIGTGRDGAAEAAAVVRQALADGYETCLELHKKQWEQNWLNADVEIKGDEDAQLALRYSMYQLMIIAPYTSEKVSIPARGLSGQVYKGAVFWDTEMFMLPFFLHTNPAVARNLMMYRVHTLDGARRKAAEYGFRGAFYAWESQDTGDDACTLFNVTDVFTKRPLRTYFRDKQVHISADVALGIWRYYELTGDKGLFVRGGAEVILECARFFYSYAYCKPEKERYEILDVTGPDEYHERVNNNAFTNYMVLNTLDTALKTVELMEGLYPEEWLRLREKLDYSRDLEQIRHMRDRLYIPLPSDETLLIQQFDGYWALEDLPLEELRKRVLIPNEYWGGGAGLATTTQIIKQADTVLLLHLFKDRFSREVKAANWNYYEPRTEHGSSLSSCIYALVATDIGRSDWAYPYFMKTAMVDLTGDSKQYVGDLYIGGTHPAANGGAWMAAIQGFAGVHAQGEHVCIRPSLPRHWQEIRFSLQIAGQRFAIRVNHTEVGLQGAAENTGNQKFLIGASLLECGPGEAMTARYKAETDSFKGAVFDLDGVIVDTAKYHYLAWKWLAGELGFDFSEQDNERLKGVSRDRSLDILLEAGGIQVADEEKPVLAERKNARYVEYISQLTPSALLPGVEKYLQGLRSRGISIALGSASKNAAFILQRLGISDFFDAVIDGNRVAEAKPDPEVFLLACRELGLRPEECIVFEDAAAGVEAARAAGMKVIGIGDKEILSGADQVVAGFHHMEIYL